VSGGFAPRWDAAAPSHGMAFARTALILSKSASSTNRTPPDYAEALASPPQLLNALSVSSMKAVP
jgi:hypothetical protein